MLLLGIDSSAKTASCGIMMDDKTIVDITLDNNKTHSEKLLEMIDTSLKLTNHNISDIDAFCVCKGPGSFTGLRIGLTTIKGLCHALNKPCYMCSTLDALYENVKNDYNEDFLIVPIMDARRNEVYAACFLNGEKIVDDTAIKIADLFDVISKIKFDKILFTGDGVSPNKELIENEYKDRVYFAKGNDSYARGTAVIKASIKNESVCYNNILPNYLRKSQAERVKTEGKQ